MLFHEWDEDAVHQIWKEDGIILGKQEDARNALRLGLTVEQVGKITGLDVQSIQQLQMQVR